MNLQIQKGVEKPEGLATRAQRSDTKYAEVLSQMEVGDYVEVPKEWYFGEGEPFDQERYNPKQMRGRVNNAVRGWALKRNKEAQKKEGFDVATFKPIRFTVAARENGNIGVWRDQ